MSRQNFGQFFQKVTFSFSAFFSTTISFHVSTKFEKFKYIETAYLRRNSPKSRGEDT